MQLNQEFKLDSIFNLFYTNKYNNSNGLGLQVQENINIFFQKTMLTSCLVPKWKFIHYNVYKNIGTLTILSICRSNDILFCYKMV